MTAEGGEVIAGGNREQNRESCHYDHEARRQSDPEWTAHVPCPS